MESATSQVTVGRHGRLLTVELNRPEAINALNLEMIQRIDAALDQAADDDTVDAVWFSGAGERGFCAGGDVRQLYLDVRAGRVEAPREYFQTEYALNARLAEFPKPTIAWMHGACMGGGVGIAGHCRIRIATETVRVAMPETKIGFTPDVGGSWLLGRAPGHLGERLGLHGQSMAAPAAIAAGFADLFIDSSHRERVRDALADSGSAPAELADVLTEFAQPTGAADFGLPLEVIDEVYALPTLADIIARLRECDPSSALELEGLSPTSLEVTLRSVRAARSLSLREALAQELRLAEWFFTERDDALEGIRALLVDKDRSPRWPSVASSFPI